MRTLFLLVTSERPDAYLNSVTHCVYTKGVTEIVFLFVHGADGSLSEASQTSADDRAAAVERWVVAMAEGLTVGEYRGFSSEFTRVNVNLHEHYSMEQISALQQIYRPLLGSRIHWRHRDIQYSNLREEIATIARQKPEGIVDVSSVSKVFLGDLVAASIIEGLDSLYTFQIIPRVDYKHPWTALYHDLQPSNNSNASFKYTNLLETAIFRECSRSLLIRRPTYQLLGWTSIVLLAATFGSYFWLGGDNLIVQGAFLVSAVGSIISMISSLFPPRR